jgi:hypothetical protein
VKEKYCAKKLKYCANREAEQTLIKAVCKIWFTHGLMAVVGLGNMPTSANQHSKLLNWMLVEI